MLSVESVANVFIMKEVGFLNGEQETVSVIGLAHILWTFLSFFGQYELSFLSFGQYELSFLLMAECANKYIDEILGR